MSNISQFKVNMVFKGNRHTITKTCLFKYTENFTIKKWKFSDNFFLYFFHISAQNIDCGYSLEPPRRGGSNEYPQSMFWAEIRKNNVYPCKPQFYYIKVGFKEVKLYRHVFVMLGRFSTFFNKGDNFCYCPFLLLLTKTLLKRGLL